MSALSIQPVYPIFTDIDGQPLEAGYVWIGQANLDPQVNPINVYWDEALTISATQPIRTLGGYPSRNGTPARLYVSSDYSIRVMNKNGSVLYNEPEGANLMSAAFITFIQPLPNAVERTVQSKLEDFVSVMDFMTPAQIAAVRAGNPVDVIDAIDDAIAASNNIYFPSGSYGVSRPIVIQKEKVNLRGPGGYGPYGQGTQIGGEGLATIYARSGFTGTTVGGSTGSAVIWYQAPGTWTNNDWIEGGCFENLTIDCGNRGVEGIRFNRITLGQVFRNLRIVQPTIGIFGTKWGWLTEFDNVYVNEASVTAIRLNNGYNGCTFVNCALYGGNISTPVLLDLALDCYGNSFTGGFIEGGDVAVRLRNAQIAFNGTDFEVHTQKFFEIKGLYSGSPPTLNAANPVVTITGCTFVGVPSVAGIEVEGGAAEVHGNFFINNGSAPPAGVFCMEGLAGGDQTVSGFEAMCISESNNTARGWNGQLTTGIVFSRVTSIAAGTTSVSKLQSGDTTSRLPENTPYNANLTGKSKAMQVFGYMLPTTSAFVEGWSARHLGDVATGVTDGQNSYVANHYDVDSAAVKLEASNQGGSPVSTYGRAGLYASITQYQTTLAEYGALTDTIGASFRPLTNNSHKLGDATYRWSEVFAINGTINTSDAREKQQVRDLDAAELATAQQLKGKIKAFKWNHAVEKKGDGARIHIGAMAQEVAATFVENGLDPDRYGIFCRDVWYTLNGEVVIADANGNVTLTHYELDGEVVGRDEEGKLPDGAVEVTTVFAAERHEQFGLRYEQLLAFIIAAI